MVYIPSRRGDRDIYMPHIGCEVEGVMVSFSKEGEPYFVNYDWSWGRVENSITFADKFWADDLLDKTNYHIDVPSGHGIGVRLPNGGRLYGDPVERIDDSLQIAVPKKLVEFAFPPTTSPDQSANMSLGAIRWVEASSLKLGQTHVYPDDRSSTVFEVQPNRLKARQQDAGKALPNFRIGYHQNISIPSDSNFLRVMRPMSLGISSMALIVGEGSIVGDELVRSDRACITNNDLNLAGVSEASMGWYSFGTRRDLDSGMSQGVKSRIEISCNDYPTSNSAALLSNGATALIFALHANGLAPDMEDVIGEIESTNPSVNGEYFKYFGGNANDHASGNLALVIQSRYLDAAKQLVKDIDDAGLSRSYKSVLQLWEKSIDQAKAYLQEGVLPDYPISGWLYATKELQARGSLDLVKGNSVDIFRSYESGYGQGDAFAFNRPPQSSNAYFKEILYSALYSSKEWIVHTDWELAEFWPSELGVTNDDQRCIFDMSLESGVGTADWVKAKFGTYHPDPKSVVDWAREQYKIQVLDRASTNNEITHLPNER